MIKGQGEIIKVYIAQADWFTDSHVCVFSVINEKAVVLSVSTAYICIAFLCIQTHMHMKTSNGCLFAVSDLILRDPSSKVRKGHREPEALNTFRFFQLNFCECHFFAIIYIRPFILP